MDNTHNIIEELKTRINQAPYDYLLSRVSARLIKLHSENITLKTNQNDLLAILDAIIDRWDTPLWKDVPGTAEYINAARKIVAKARGGYE